MINRRSILAGLVAAPMMARSAWAQAPMNVVATTGMIADTATRIGGDAVTVTGLMGPGVDPHAYRQTRSDIVAMTRADLTLWHGLFLEAQMQDFFADLGRKRNVVAVADDLPRELLLAHDDYADKFDPHVWMVPALWQPVADRIYQALHDTRPEVDDVLSANKARFDADLAALQSYAQTVLLAVPEKSRVLVTAHDAFGYFGNSFGFDVMGVQGISTQSEAGIARITELVNMLVERDIRAVFVESSVSDRNMRALIEGAAAKGHTVTIGGELFSDAMGAAGTYEGTYIGMIDHNVTTIARALGATDVPAKGLNGKLRSVA